MATVIVTISMEFTEEESKSFVEKTGEAAVKAFRLPPTLRDVYLYTIPPYRQTPHEDVYKRQVGGWSRQITCHRGQKKMYH